MRSLAVGAFRVSCSLQLSLALVTGGGSGIGKTIALALVQNGAKVYIAARKESQLKEVDSISFSSPFQNSNKP